MIDVSDDGTVTTITMDDGKANALGPQMQAALNAALDEAEGTGRPLVLAGRTGRFSGGFDLNVMAAGGDDALEMVVGGFSLARRLLAHESPVVVACTGHAIAAGAFLLLSGDLRIGAAGEFKIAANEVAIGMTMPYSAVELMRARLEPASMQRSALLAETFDPIAAVTAGYLDRIVAPEEVLGAAQAAAAAAAALHGGAHQASKRRVRADLLARLDEAIAADRRDLESLR